jgi:hypothetical protein
LADPYSIIANYPNAGQAFSDSFNHGMQQNALAGFAMNPNNPSAQGQAARYDPGAVMQYKLGEQRAQAELGHQQLTEWHKYAGELAKWADTPQKWDQAIDYLLQSNHPDVSTQQLMALKGHFDPGLRASFMALGGVQDDNSNQPKIIPLQAGGSVVQYDPATGGIKPLVLPNDGSQATAAPAGGNMPTVSSPQEAMSLPPGTQFRMPDGRIGTVPGGAGGNASGGFPGPH